MLSQHKLGLAVLGQPKTKILKELGIEPQRIYGRNSPDSIWSENRNDSDDYAEEDEEEQDDPLNWTGFIKIDAIIYPTMQGTLDIDQEGPLYILQSTLSLPDGTAHITDEFEYFDYLTMRNDLSISTPYDSFKLITSSYKFQIKPGSKYEVGLGLDYQNRTRWIKTGIYGRYEMNVGDGSQKDYNINLQVHSPFQSLPALQVQAYLEMVANTHQANLSVTTNNSRISVTSQAEEHPDGLLEENIFLHVKTPSFEIPPTSILLKKDFKPSDNLLEARINMERVLKKEIFLRTNWLLRSLRDFHVFILLETPYKGMENSLVGVKMLVTDDSAFGWTVVKLHPLEITVNSTLAGNVFNTISYINFNGKEYPMRLSGNVVQNQINRMEYFGNLILKEKEFRLSGHVQLLGNLPVEGQIKLTPEDGSDPLYFEYKLESKQDGRYLVLGSARHAGKFATFEANALARHQLDWQLDLRVNTSLPTFDKFTLQANATSTTDEKYITVEAHTPIPKLENPKIGASVVASDHRHIGRAYFELTDSSGDIQGDWIYIFMEDMYIRLVGNYENRQYRSQSSLEGFYVNPNQSFKFIKVGGDANVDTLWSAGSNVTLSLPNYQNISLKAHLKLPAPVKEVYSVEGKVKYDKDTRGRSLEYFAKYRTVISPSKYGSSGNISLIDKSRLEGDVEVEWNEKRVNNHLDLRNAPQNTWKLLYMLRTPKFPDKAALVTEMSYISSGAYHNVTCDLFYPERRSFASAQVDFQQFANMNGTVNVTIPFRGINYTGAHFVTKTNARVYNRYLEIFWPNDNVVVDCKCVTERGTSLLENNTTGVLVIEVPLQTRHVADVKFKYNEKQGRSTGHTTVDYNRNQVLEGNYNCLSESRAGFDKKTIHVEVQNKLVPVGADYVHGYEYGAPRDGSSAPTLDSKDLHLYHLTNRSKLDISGKMNVRTSSTGRQIAFSATHSNRTVKLSTDYAVLEQQFKQHSRLELSSSTWIEYQLAVLNRTESEAFDSQQLQLTVAYPKRNFTAIGAYNVSDSSMATDVSLIWDNAMKNVQAGFDWQRVSAYRDEIRFLLKHPSLEKNITFFGEYESEKGRPFDAQLTVDYSTDPERTVKIGARLNDDSSLSAYNYNYNAWVTHPRTNLNVTALGELIWSRKGYSTQHFINYRRDYLPLLSSERMLRVDLLHNEMEIKSSSGDALLYLWTRYGGSFPTYTANISTANTSNAYEENNSTGRFYVNFNDKLVLLNYNMTTDGSQSFHMYGVIPDARSAMFDIWRDYEDIRISDVAYYLRLNHSRLIMSSLRWRPELKHDIQNITRTMLKQVYDDMIKKFNESQQYVMAEANESVSGVWNDAKPVVQQLLDDLRSLREIEKDFEEFKVFLNNSYNANEFYIKDIVNLCLLVFDDLALKSHFESLPAIVSEIWEVMGESGAKIKKSILWVVEKVKTYYRNTSDFIRGLLDGDPIVHLSEAFKSIVERYDTFIKDLHVAFIQYVERLFAQMYTLVVTNWHKTLAAIEPTFLKMIHYLETMAFNTGREFLDFLYIRKSELIEDPYFAKFTNFTHDIDRFYRDITGDNTIRSIIKYTKIVWDFLEERYFSKIPFGKELKDIVVEILDELNKLRNLSSIRYLEEKWNAFYSHVKWFYDYFEIENRLHRFITLLHSKLTDMSQTALQAENRYRVAKTKFIFEPNDGLMQLEQKLPMSWHAFNETPKIQEIPELQMVYNLQSYFLSTQASFWDFYHDYMPYTKLSGWLPPFKAQAFLVGSRYYVTFDRQYYSFRGNCSYLLATDYADRNFSVVVSNAGNPQTQELVLVINKTLVQINLFTDTIKVGTDGTTLPAQIGDTILYREDEVVVIKSESGFTLECNLKFDVCAFEAAGWYFGKTAGLWGTINNEPSDDFLTSAGMKTDRTGLDVFTKSWALGQCSESGGNPELSASVAAAPSPIREICGGFFASKLSQLSTCFPRVPNEEFLWMCLNSTTEEGACSSALAYINLCAYSNIPLRIPDVCVKCNSPNGTQLNEGQSIRLEVPDLPQSVDVVFIIEAKECNKHLRTIKNFDSIIGLLHKELEAQGLRNNRYSLVVFGGDGVFEEARTVVVNNKIFADYQQIITHFDSIPTGNGTLDIFGAISFATKLLFRPGVSRNFILLPCSECKEENMKLDYASVHQLLLDSDVTLHILMNEEFAPRRKTRENKIPFGIDRNYAYSKKDIQRLTGDVTLRKQVSLPKSTLGYCTSLALETNGTVFSSSNLRQDQRRNVKKFALVFGKRVAASARLDHCVDCECNGFNTGVSYMECYPCNYPARPNIDYESEVDQILNAMQPIDDNLGSFESR